MTQYMRAILFFGFMAALFIIEGSTNFWIFSGSWNTSLVILNMALVSAVMALGVNLQWGYAGLFNTGIMGFVALGGLAVVVTSLPPVTESWSAGGYRIILGLILGALTIAGTILMRMKLPQGRLRGVLTLAILIGGFFLYRAVFDSGVQAVEAIDPSVTGNIGGLGLPVLVAWPVGGLLAAGAAWIIGKTALGLRSDYLAIATLGIAEIIVAILKNEEWLSRGAKNVNGLPRPVPYEVDLQQSAEFVANAASFGLDPVTASTLYVKIGYALLFTAVLVTILVLSQLARHSPWGRMMRAIRDNETAARAMGKNVTRRHLEIFILGSAVCGFAGAMMTTLDGQLTPASYHPLRFTFLIWVMVIVGGSGNNLGSVLGGFLIWWLWVKVEPLGQWLAQVLTYGLPEGHWVAVRITEAAAHMRLFTMGLVLLFVLRFNPRGMLPEN
ncbi:branched-chain amino acid ABC transporter permease [Marivivens sp. JLT3646]|uniref:branched-chain amino acid ABC transporter permease n=1 Tax=Marivivens sp. JLT3646 TaxID=1920883 RepID=UPI000801CB3F|nr:branched-chain amino acid ABC transporter permease [Marivivens sp. JLT3646]APO86712.1 branched-chain amino acid ABC transporter permease [Marivivens sp. JLT3646]OBR39443.1 branched-chain amino acid ABC transporter permease [Donghicola sp. JL3646]